MRKEIILLLYYTIVSSLYLNICLEIVIKKDAKRCLCMYMCIISTKISLFLTEINYDCLYLFLNYLFYSFITLLHFYNIIKYKIYDI